MSEDKFLTDNNYAGYCSEEEKLIVIADMNDTEHFQLTDKEKESYEKRVLRHELIHAFLNESGLSSDSSVPAGAWAKHEEMIDWLAIQSPKIFATFKHLNLI